MDSELGGLLSGETFTIVNGWLSEVQLNDPSDPRVYSGEINEVDMGVTTGDIKYLMTLIEEILAP